MIERTSRSLHGTEVPRVMVWQPFKSNETTERAQRPHWQQPLKLRNRSRL